MNIETANMGSFEMTIEIEAPASRVWAALTNDIGNWWPADFYSGGEDNNRTFVLEPVPGGRMYEQWDKGGVLWGTVVGVNPNKQLQVSGLVFPSFGGPTHWYGTWDLTEEKGGTTVLRYSETDVGKVTASGAGEKIKGWSYLWNCMHAYIDGRPAPAWE